MRTKVNAVLEEGRLLVGHYATRPGELSGAFNVVGPLDRILAILSSGPDYSFGWEHVSVSCQDRAPVWLEMCMVKDLFWDQEEAVMQLHPPRSDYVNFHPYCLHLWRPMFGKIPLPPSELVGPKR